MSMDLTRAQVDAERGDIVLEFGSANCGYCIAAQPLIDKVVGKRPQWRHVKVEDGRGRPLGRSFGIKLWPTLVFMRDGREVGRVVRPHDESDFAQAVAALD